MNVWIINPFDNLPVEGYRPQRYWLMSEAFARAGHRVTYWTQNWSHARKDERRLTGGRTLEDLSAALPFTLKFVRVLGYRRNICLKRIWSPGAIGGSRRTGRRWLRRRRKRRI